MTVNDGSGFPHPLKCWQIFAGTNGVAQLTYVTLHAGPNPATEYHLRT